MDQEGGRREDQGRPWKAQPTSGACQLHTAQHLRGATCSSNPSAVLHQTAGSLGRLRDEPPQLPVDKLRIRQFCPFIFPSVLFQETCVFFFVCLVDLPQLVLTAVDSVKRTHYKNSL